MSTSASHKWQRSLLSQAVTWVLVWVAVSATAYAQVVSARLSGTVTDASGGVVPDATVTATNAATGISVTSRTDSAGEYVFLSLPPGKYNLVTNKEGFKSTALSGIELVVHQQARVDISMEVGDLRRTVEVAGAAPLVDTSTASIGTVIGEMQVVKLPLNLRRYGSLAVLVPGTTPDNGGTASGPLASPFSETTYNANGARSNSNNYLVDGTDSKNMGQGGFASQPPPDAVQEFKIQTNVYSAVFGVAPGSTINLVTKSGTNDIHGSVYEFARNDIFDARNYFSPDVSKNNRNQFGFALGGPIIKNRTFRFVNYEGLRESKALGGFSIHVPDGAERAGDFSSYLTGNTLNLCGTGGPANLEFDTGQLFDPGTLSMSTCPAGSANAGKFDSGRDSYSRKHAYEHRPRRTDAIRRLSPT